MSDKRNVSDADQAVRGLLERTFGERAGEFTVEPLEPSAGRHVFEVDHDGTGVMLRGSSGVAQASALRWYLRTACQIAVTWDNPHPVLPKRLPGISTRKVAKLRHFYYLQPCTYSYTTAFWDWGRWQQEIDWMALHGVDLPLSMTGQESVWQRTFRRVGVPDDEILRFLGGPGYLPFVFMSCVSDWAGPLPQSWIDEHVALATRILARQREFGMTTGPGCVWWPGASGPAIGVCVAGQDVALGGVGDAVTGSQERAVCRAEQVFHRGAGRAFRYRPPLRHRSLH